MMKHFEMLFLTAGIVSSLLLLAGLVKPYGLLWWKATQNRRMVIRLYGSIAIVCFITYSVLRYL